MEYKFIKICGDCSIFSFLEKERIEGPVDNISVINSLNVIKLLIEKKYLKEVISGYIKKEKNYYGLSQEFKYVYNDFEIIHNIPTEKYISELFKRINNFDNFYKNINKEENYFLFTVFKVIEEKEFIDILEYLKSINVLDKTIFVNSHNNNPNYEIKNIQNILNKYDIKYIELKNDNPFVYSDEYNKKFLYNFKKLIKEDKNDIC